MAPITKFKASALFCAAVLVFFFKWFVTGPWLHFALFATFALGFYAVSSDSLRSVLRAQGRFGLFVVAAYVTTTSLAFVFFADSSPARFFEIFRNSFLSREALLFGLAIPFFEELFFRGAVQSFLKEQLTFVPEFRRNFWIVYWQALVFWLFHLPVNTDAWAQALAQGGIPMGPGPFLLGLVCGFIRARDNSIAWAIVFHGLANLSGAFWYEILKVPWLIEIFYT